MGKGLRRIIPDYVHRAKPAIGGQGRLHHVSAQSAGDPLWVNTNGAADVANPNQFDFHLQAGSPAIDTGVFLAKTTTAGSGTVIPLEDAGYFIDSYGIVPGDRVQLEGQTQTVGITAVDYTTNQITVDASLVWTAGQGVSLPYSGSAPDIGAYER